jgi:para-nitrobenzyl esterase
MLASPLASGLFHRAISQSGAPFSNKMKSGEARAEEVLLQVLVNDGSASTISEARRLLRGKDGEWARSYLRSKTPAEIYDCYEAGTFGSAGGSNQVFVDGAVIPMSPWKTLARGKYNNVPFMAGANREEAKLFLPLVLSNLDEPELCNLIRDIDPDNPDVTLSDYMNPFNKMIYDPIADISGAGFQVVGVDMPAHLISRRQDHVYAYRFGWDQEPEPLDFVIGAGHGVEMPFMFGNFQTGPDDVLRFAWSEENKAGREELSKRMMSYWANFAKTGDPNGPGLPEWKPYSNMPGHNRMVLDVE